MAIFTGFILFIGVVLIMISMVSIGFLLGSIVMTREITNTVKKYDDSDYWHRHTNDRKEFMKKEQA